MKTECRLIYIDEQVDINGNPVNIETSKQLNDDIAQWSSGYYEDRNRDMMLSCNLRIARNYLRESSCGQLRYVDYRCIRYMK